MPLRFKSNYILFYSLRLNWTTFCSSRSFFSGFCPSDFVYISYCAPPPFVPAKCSSRVFCQSLPYNLKNKEYIRGGRFFLHLLIERAFASQGAPVRCVFPQFFVLYPKGCGTPRLISPQVSFFAKMHLGLSGTPPPINHFRYIGWVGELLGGERHSTTSIGGSATQSQLWE